MTPDRRRAAILECFRPALAAEAEGAALDAVKQIVADVQEAHSRMDGDRLVCVTWRPGDTEESYRARAKEALTRPTEGAHPDTLLHITAWWCRELLRGHACRYGVSKDETKPCGLASLVRQVNELAGKPCFLKSEAALRRAIAADRASNPARALEFWGIIAPLTDAERPEFARFWREAERYGVGRSSFGPRQGESGG